MIPAQFRGKDPVQRHRTTGREKWDDEERMESVGRSSRNFQSRKAVRLQYVRRKLACSESSC